LSDSQRERRKGLLAGAAAYGMWGLFPIYFKALAAVPPLEILAHRVAWAVLLLLVLVRSREQMASLRAALRGRSLLLLAASSLMIGLNWLVYLWSILTDRILEASLGYFITPLVSVLLGVVVLREPLERPLLIATGLAGFGVAWMTLGMVYGAVRTRGFRAELVSFDIPDETNGAVETAN